MSDNTKQNLKQLLAGCICRIPDYQRGYAWEAKQVNDLIQDIDALVSDENVASHYMGTIVTYRTNDDERYQGAREPVLEVVDGQQRLTSLLLFLSVVFKKLKEIGEAEYETYKGLFLYCGEVPKLILNGDDCNFYLSLLKNGGMLTGTVTEVNTPQRKRLKLAAEAFRQYLETCNKDKLVSLYDVMTSRLFFSSYSIEEKCEIGMTFELMNSRGKELSVLELLKNYLMYWISRNASKEDRDDITRAINTSWAEVFKYLGGCDGDDEQCLRICWTNYFAYLPKKWKGYDGFKEPDCIPIRDFSKRSKDEVSRTIKMFIDSLVVVARNYAEILRPSNRSSRLEIATLDDLKHTGNTANTRPLVVALSIAKESGRITSDEYITALKAIECFSFRTFLWERRRSNAGISQLFRLAYKFTEGVIDVNEIVKAVYGLANYYAPANKFKTEIYELQDWYSRPRLVRCVLFAYERYLVDKHHPGEALKISWEEVAAESTIEHILPQTPEVSSHWREVWSEDQITHWKHALGNLVFTKDNSRYLNFEFERKKNGEDDGTPASERYCYANSNIMQERQIADYPDWTCDDVKKRHDKLLTWMVERWCPDIGNNVEIQVQESEDEDDDV